MQHWHVLLDLDGTVAQNAGRRLAARHFGVTISEEQYGDSLPQLLGLTEEAFWAWWHENQEEIYDLAEPLPGAAQVLQALKETGAEITVVTARRPTAETVTVRWLQRHNIPYDRLVFGADDKVSVARELTLNIGFEDDPANAMALAELMPMILIENFKNRTHEISHQSVYRVAGWHEVGPLLRDLAARPA